MPIADRSRAAVLDRRTIVAPDGTRLSVLVATPPAGTPPARALPPVLAVHGFASSAESGWRRTGHLDALTRAGRVVIAPDLRGHGHSARPHRTDAYRLEAVLADLVAVVGTVASGYTDAAAVTRHPGDGLGSDSGGTAVTRHPGDGLGSDSGDTAVTRQLGGGPLGGPDVPPMAQDPADTAAAPARPGPIDLLGYSLGARLCWTLACRDLVSGRRMVLGGFDGRPLFAGVDTERLEALAAGVPDNDRVALRHLVDGLAGTGGTRPDGPLPDVPTLLVAGDRDPLATRAEQFARNLPQGSFLAVSGRQHISAVPAAVFRRAVVDFLAGQRIAAGAG